MEIMAPKQFLRNQPDLRPQNVKDFVKELETTAVEFGENLTTTTTVVADKAKKYVTLGPCYPGDMPPVVEKVLLKQTVDESCYFDSGEWDRWNKKYGWPTSTKGWSSWVSRVEREYGETWKQLGIYDAIKISSKALDWDRSLLSAALCFWNSTTNTLDLRCGPLSPTLIDLAALLGLSPSGQIVDIYFGEQGDFVNLTAAEETKTTKLRSRPTKEKAKLHRFGNWIEVFNEASKTNKGRGRVSRLEHAAFLALWLCKFVVCTDSGTVTKEHYRIAEALVSEEVSAKGQPVAFGPFVLGRLYRCLNQIVCNGMSFKGGGPLWVFQLWLQTYFPALRSPGGPFVEDEPIGIQLANLPLPTHTAATCFAHLYNCAPFGHQRFSVCYNHKYPAFLTVDMSRERDEHDPLFSTAVRAWRSATITRDLYVGLAGDRARKYGFELYYPALFSRQFGFLQSIPYPEYNSANGLSSCRADYNDIDAVEEYRALLKNNTKWYKVRPRVATANMSTAFSPWWARRVRARFEDGLEVSCESAVGKLPWEKPASTPVAGLALARCSQQPKLPTPRKRKRTPESAGDAEQYDGNRPDHSDDQLVHLGEDDGAGRVSPMQALFSGGEGGDNTLTIDDVGSANEEEEEEESPDSSDEGQESDESADIEIEEVEDELPHPVEVGSSAPSATQPAEHTTPATTAVVPYHDESMTEVGKPSTKVDVLVLSQDAHARLARLRAKNVLHVPLSSSETEKAPLISPDTEKARSTIRQAKMDTPHDFIDRDHLKPVGEALNVLIQGGLLPSSLSTRFEDVLGRAAVVADHAQKKADCQLNLEAEKQLEVELRPLAARVGEMSEAFARCDEKKKALEAQLLAATQEWESVARTFVETDELFVAKQTELEGAKDRAKVAQARLTQLESDEKAFDTALSLFKSDLNV